MKKLFSLGFTVVLLAFTSCSEDNSVTNYYNNIEDAQITLEAKSLIAEASNPFQAKGPAFDNSYTHQLPANYKAYFVADETRGQYTMGQVVKIHTVVSGQNTVTVPKMKVKIYVTNYIKPNGNESQPNAWYTWSTAIDQLPQTSTSLNLYGFNSADYATATTSTVTLANPYSAVMIKNNQWVSAAPTSYDTNQAYTLVGNNSWYNLYIRNNNTNTKIPINIPGNPNQHYTLSRTIAPNKIYQYTINGNVLEDDGNLGIVTVDMEAESHEQIDL